MSAEQQDIALCCQARCRKRQAGQYPRKAAQYGFKKFFFNGYRSKILLLQPLSTAGQYLLPRTYII